MADTIKCKHNNKEHENCFSRTKNGRCECLSNCDFNDGKCHFYKPKEQKRGK